MTSLEGQAWFRIANHLAGNPILSEPTLRHDVRFLVERAGIAVGVRVDVNVEAIMRTLSLVVKTAPPTGPTPQYYAHQITPEAS